MLNQPLKQHKATQHVNLEQERANGKQLSRGKSNMRSRICTMQVINTKQVNNQHKHREEGLFTDGSMVNVFVRKN